jgi:Cyclic phosphodiesterase-like protein
MMLYSIWLLPQTAQEQALQAVIDALAEQYGTVRFQPHLTVCSSLQNTAALDAASAYVRGSGLLPLTVTIARVGSGSESPFRAIFVEIENSPALQEFREGLRDLTGGGELHPPHISLLYTLDRDTQRPMPQFDAARLGAIAEECNTRIPRGDLILDRAAVKTAQGGWENVRSWALLRTL